MSPLAPQSPYARTKLMMEQVLVDLCAATKLRAVVLRYFNPIGADPDLELGVHAREPSHVLGQLIRAATGQQEAFTLTGTDLPTPDGTGVRDYVHVWDLARAHVAAVERFDTALDNRNSTVINVGTGAPITVRQLIAKFEQVFGREVPVLTGPARPGDAIGAYANVDKAATVLGWRSQLSVTEAVSSALAWSAKRKQVLGYD